MTKVSLSLAALLLMLGLAVTTAADGHDEKGPAVTEAVAVIAPTRVAKSPVNGVVLLKQDKGHVLVTGEVTGLTPGKHGFHIHMFGDTRANDGMSVGGHYNPKGHKHGGPESAEHHGGDLGNIEADAQGVAKFSLKAEGVELGHILGRSLVVHGDVDDLKSDPAGNAGPRIAIGVIGLVGPPPPKKP